MAIKKALQKLEKIYESLQDVFLFKEAYESFKKHEDFPIDYQVSVETEEDAEQVYEKKAALAEMDLTDAAKETLELVKDFDKFIEEHKDEVKKRTYEIWKRRYRKITKNLEKIKRGDFDEDAFKVLDKFYELISKVV